LTGKVALAVSDGRVFNFVSFWEQRQTLRRIAARLRTTAIKKVSAKSVLHMAMSPRWLKRNLFYFVTFLDSSSSRWPKAILRNATARVSSRGMVIAWPLAALAIHCRGVGNGVSQCKFVGIATCTRKGPCPTCRCRLHKRPRGQSVRRMGSRNRFLLALFQGIHFLPQGFKDADPRRYNYQHRT
jgi:hypothetical protein